MTTRRYKQGISRQQGMLLPPRIEEYITEDNPVRAIDVYIDSLDLEALGFSNIDGGQTPGQPAYQPSTILKLYLYGYLNRVRSSRRLEKETHRNLEVIWLLRGLRPSYKTIADFRKDNLKALKEVNKDFLQVCKELGLFGGELVGIDGSYFRGNVSKGSIYTEKRIQKALDKLEKQIESYLEEMDKADAEEASQERDDKSLEEKLAALKERQQKHQERLEKLRESGERQLAEVDEDARLLSKNGQSVAGYNVQIAVDEKHKLLVACEVTNEGNDLRQLEPMAKNAKQVLEVETLEAVADTGYFNVQHIKACIEAGITPYVPEQDWQTRVLEQDRFSRRDFHYNAELDGYECPTGQLLKRKSTMNKNGKLLFGYASQASVCAQCSRKATCLPAKTPYRQIFRWEHEHILETHRERMTQQGGEKMRQRAALAEHPFGTLKQWCGGSHFLLRGKEKVSTEMALLMLSYNIKRVLNILGLETFRTYCLLRAKNRPGETKKLYLEHVKDAFFSLFQVLRPSFLIKWPRVTSVFA